METLTVRVEALSGRSAVQQAVAQARREGFDPVRVIDSNLVMDHPGIHIRSQWDITLRGDRIPEGELRALDGNR